MKFRFIYEDNMQEMILSCYKADVKIIFIDNNPVELYVDDRDYKPTEDVLDGIFCLYAGKHFSLNAILKKAVEEFDGFLQETLQQIEDEQEMISELSCPRKTGRV